MDAVTLAAMAGAYDFTSHLTRFCRTLRQHGLILGPLETADAIRALDAVDIMDRGRVYWTLRTVLVSRREELPVFDDLFQRLWDFEPMPVREPGGRTDDRFGLTRDFGRSQRPLVVEHDEGSDDVLVQVQRVGASATEVVSDRDLNALRSDELSELSRIAARLVRALAAKPGRRRKRHRRKGEPDLRGALRISLTSGGEPIRLPRRRRVPRVPRLLVLLDVSGSMDRYVQLLLQLVYAVSQHTKRVETYVFSTSVTRVTQALSAPAFGESLRRIGRVVNHWSGGTRIGECLGRINEDRKPLRDRYTTVFLLSDGWDTGDPQVLARQMARLRNRVRTVVWLNPLLGTADYEPLTRGLQAALPHVDHFVSASNVDQLKRLPALLR